LMKGIEIQLEVATWLPGYSLCTDYPVLCLIYQILD